MTATRKTMEEGLAKEHLFSAMNSAIMNDNIQEVKDLLRAGLDVNKKDYSGLSALMSAAACDRKEIMRLLIEHGADIDESNKDGDTALIFAVQYGHKDTVQLLIDKGADPNKKNLSGRTALSWAKFKGQQATADILQQAIEARKTQPTQTAHGIAFQRQQRLKQMTNGIRRAPS
jgi:ankyrin repeat protein